MTMFEKANDEVHKIEINVKLWNEENIQCNLMKWEEQWRCTQKRGKLFGCVYISRKSKRHHVSHFNFLHHQQKSSTKMYRSLKSMNFAFSLSLSFPSIFEQFKPFGTHTTHTHTFQCRYFSNEEEIYAINVQVTKVTLCTIDRYIICKINGWLLVNVTIWGKKRGT